MTIKASGRSVLILATGLFVCFAGPSPVAAGTNDKAAADSQAASSESDSAAAEPVARHKYVRHGSHHSKRYAHHKSGEVALKSAARKADATDVVADVDTSSTAIPPSVANANAQLAAADTPDSNDTLAGSAKAMSARANDMLQAAPEKPVEGQPAAEVQVIPPDQLNDVDRTLPAGGASAAAPAMTAADAPAQATASADAPDEAVAASSDDSSSVDRTSLIGKIFMACGGVLTLASAVRMFMA